MNRFNIYGLPGRLSVLKSGAAKSRWLVQALLVYLPLLMGLIFQVACNSSQTRKNTFQIAVVPQGSTHEFWKSIHAGAVKAARDFGDSGIEISILWQGPVKEDGREEQIQIVEGFLGKGVDGIVLAPADRRALVRPIEEARAAGIPTVVIDSKLDYEGIISFLATDNYGGGALAAERLGAILGGHGRVLMLRYQEGVASTEDRASGFLDKIVADFPNIKIVSSNQYAGPTRETAKRTAENLLNLYGDSIEGVFTVNESSTAGMLLALEDVHKDGEIRFVGFDSSDVFVTAMRKNTMEGIVVQNPFRMGEMGVRAIVDHLMGKSIPKKADTGAALVTPDNLDNPDTRRLLYPPLQEYLSN